jgi:hypothetical protein
MPRVHHELGDAPPSVTTPTWLELARRQAARRRPADLLAQWERDAYVAPSMLDGRTMHALDGLALAAAEGFEALVLSPVAPLGSCSVVAPTSQDRTLSANRGTEVISDPTNVLALECARRLRAAPASRLRLCTVHQVLRCQPLPPGKALRTPPGVRPERATKDGFSRHFRMFVLVEAGPARADDGFEVDAFAGHVDVLVRLCDRAEAFGWRLRERALVLRTAPGHEVLAERIATRLRQTGLPMEREPLESPYYDGVRVLFNVRTAAGDVVPLGDIGRFDWVARLAANRRMRMIASGFGLQLLPLRFGASDGE